MKKSDIYGTSTEGIFGLNMPTTAQDISGKIGNDEPGANAPIKGILLLFGLLIGLRLVFEFV